jgi:hypothetical protein
LASIGLTGKRLCFRVLLAQFLKDRAMGGLLLFFVVQLLIASAAVGLGARMVRAPRRGLGWVVLAAFLHSALAVTVFALLPHPIGAVVVTAALGGALLSLVLGSRYWSGLAISITSSLIQGVTMLILTGISIGMS